MRRCASHKLALGSVDGRMISQDFGKGVLPLTGLSTERKGSSEGLKAYLQNHHGQHADLRHRQHKKHPSKPDFRE